MNERQKRKRNLVLFGIKEQNQQLPPEQRVDTERDIARQVVSVLDQTDDTGSITPIRLGQFSTGKDRPMKITLKDEKDVFTLIKKAKYLKNGPHNKVSISFDFTPRQISYYKEVKAELDIRNSEGPERFRIKYFDGIPKIISLNQ
nr:unnamed protein product [Callosobruchus analis]